MSTLKDNYKQRKLTQLKSKIKLAESTLKISAYERQELLEKKFSLIEGALLTEEKVVNVIAETIDKSDVEQIQKTLDAFDKIVPQGTALDAALDGIKNEMLKSLQGGLLNKVKDALTPKNAKPVARAMAFLASLKQGLTQLNVILKTALPRGTDLNQTQDATLNQLIDDQEKAKMVQNAFLKAIKPQGLFQSFSAIPYLDGENAQNVAVDLMNMTGPEVLKLMQGAQGMQTNVNKSDVQAAVQAAMNKTNTGTQGGTEASPTNANTPTKPGEAGKANAETNPSNDMEANVIKKVLPEIEDIDMGPLGDNTKIRIIKHVLQALKQPGT